MFHPSTPTLALALEAARLAVPYSTDVTGTDMLMVAAGMLLSEPESGHANARCNPSSEQPFAVVNLAMPTFGVPGYALLLLAAANGQSNDSNGSDFENAEFNYTNRSAVELTSCPPRSTESD
eukprot:s2520_g7.t1